MIIGVDPLLMKNMRFLATKDNSSRNLSQWRHSIGIGRIEI